MQRRKKIIGVAILMLSVAAAPLLSAGAKDKAPFKFSIAVTAYRAKKEYFAGEPICVRVTIRAAAQARATGPLQIGAADLPWHGNITFAVYRVAITAPRKADMPPKAKGGKRTLLKDVKVELGGPPASKVRKLMANQRVWSFWAIGPETSAKLPPGRYVIQAVFDTTGRKKSHPDLYHGQVTSNEVAITVNKPTDESSQADVLAAQARYLELKGDAKNAIKLLEKVFKTHPLKAHPKIKKLHCRLGRAYEMDGDIPNAIKHYRLYVKWVRDSKFPRTGKGGLAEHADRIERMTDALEKYLEKKRKAKDGQALVAIGHMRPELARKAARTLLTSDALPARTTGATLLAIVGREKDTELLRKALKEKVSDRFASVYRNAAAELEHKLKKATTQQLPQWERSGLVYWRICLTMKPEPRMATQSWWLAGKDVAAGKQGRVPTELLRWKVAHREPLAVSLAGHQQEEKLIPELEKLGRERGDVGRLAKNSLATIASEEAVNACLRITGTPRESEFRHQELAKFAAKNGGATTLGILKVLAEDKRFPEKVRKLYADAAERLSNRLKSPATKPTTKPASKTSTDP